jgi:Ca2+-transporting ATPase
VVNLIVVAECFYLLNCRSLTQPFFRVGWFSNLWIWGGIAVMLAVQLLFNYLPLMNRLFHSAPVRAETWLHVTLVGLVAFLLIELEKRFRFGRNAGNVAISG